MVNLKAIHSGGQTGADRGALGAGRILGLRTGGWAPKGWRTENGPNHSLEDLGLKEHHQSGYVARTVSNVKDTDGTLIFGNPHSPGSKATYRATVMHNKPVLIIHWQFQKYHHSDIKHSAELLREWLATHKIEVLNVAGNRESGNPGIHAEIQTFLVAALLDQFKP